MFTTAVSERCKRLLLTCSLVLLPYATCLAAPTFSLGSPGGVRIGDTLVLSVNASDVTDLYAYQFTLNFNPALFQAVAVTEGPFLRSGGATFFDPGLIDNSTGTISFVLDSLLGPVNGVSGAGVLDTLQFRVIGQAPFGVFSFSDAIALDSNLNLIALQTSAFTQAIPEPATLLLVFAGAAAGLARRPAKARARMV
ncbi:cohesin domain-containing protein [Piscinibacter koreensis]|uniref:PEP-CTERM sorting domain-containing protein n=1 Tax=Piscinibacter koreensis TaxID=2742824 RepID=A0A7Y6NQF8_9BURK|nr:cohesin domain-containing protein [Schlegelella koreensis]NUZ07364.1 PEP-CTERM sorting domain-containing protein [Schlegelella koreensis]